LKFQKVTISSPRREFQVHKPPLLPRNFHIFTTKITLSPTPLEFPLLFGPPPILWKEWFWQGSVFAKVKVNNPNIQLLALHVTALAEKIFIMFMFMFIIIALFTAMLRYVTKKRHN